MEEQGSCPRGNYESGAGFLIETTAAAFQRRAETIRARQLSSLSAKKVYSRRLTPRPVFPKPLVSCRRQLRLTSNVSLATSNVNDSAFTVDIPHFKRSCFGNSQAASVHHQGHRLISRHPDMPD
jgi:hypothetical protein